MMRIGIDLDNTIVNYDEAFVRAAERLDIAVGAATGKAAIRQAVRALPDGEMAWQRLQAQAYGPGIADAVPFAGVEKFLRMCRERNIPVWIVSHKTAYAAADPSVNLRDAARRWLEDRGIVGAGGPVQAVYFAATRGEKIARIRELAVTHFIDDLDEVFLEADFPSNVTQLLFGRQEEGAQHSLVSVRDWAAVAETIFVDDHKR
jgi:hypothetical protein